MYTLLPLFFLPLITSTTTSPSLPLRTEKGHQNLFKDPHAYPQFSIHQSNTPLPTDAQNTFKAGPNVTCVVPEEINGRNAINEGEVDEQTVAQIAKVIENWKKGNNGCRILQSDWWTYKFCLGKDVEQFHIDPKSPTTPSDKFSLGKHIEEGLDAHVNVKGAEIAYVEKYTGGSTCGLTKRPRTTTIEFVCRASTDMHIVSINEISTCTYALVIAVSDLCKIPVMARPTLPTSNVITCYSDNPEMHLFAPPKFPPHPAQAHAHALATAKKSVQAPDLASMLGKLLGQQATGSAGSTGITNDQLKALLAKKNNEDDNMVVVYLDENGVHQEL